MYRKFLGKSKRIAAIALAGAMVFSSMTAYAKEQEQAVSVEEAQKQTVSVTEQQQAESATAQSEQEDNQVTTDSEVKKTQTTEASTTEQKQSATTLKEEKKPVSASVKDEKATKATEEYAPTATTDYQEWLLQESMWIDIDPKGGEIKLIQTDLYKGTEPLFGTSSLQPQKEMWSDGKGRLTFDEEWIKNLREVLSHTDVKLEDMTRLDIKIQFVKDGAQKDVTIKMPLRHLSTETGKPHFMDRVIEGDALIGDKDLNVSPAYVYFGNAGTEEINLSDYEYRVRGIKNCENVELKVDDISSEPVKPGQQVEYSNNYVAVTGCFSKEYTKESAKFVVDVYAKNDPETLLYTTKEMTIYPYKIVTTDEGRVLKYNDPSHYSKYEVKVETDEHCMFEDLVGGGGGDFTEIFEIGADGKTEKTGIFVRTGYPSSFMMNYDEGYVYGTAKLDPADAGTVQMVEGSGCIYKVDVHKPATLKVTSSTEAALEGEYGLKFVTDGNTENAGTLSGMEMVVKTYEDNFDWLKRYYGANGEILAYETTVKIKDRILQNSPDLKMSIAGNAPRIYIPIPDGWDKEKIGVFYEYDMYSNAKTAEVTEDGKYVIAYPEGFDKEFAKVTTKVGIFEKIDATVAKDWETTAFNYIENIRSVNTSETFEQHFFEKTAKANDVAYMTYCMEDEKYVDNYRVGETYDLEIPYDVLVKDAAKYYKNVPDLKETNFGRFYYDAGKNAFIKVDTGGGNAPSAVEVKKVDELGNKTYAIRFEFKDDIELPTYESEATLVVEDNGQGNWRYISFLKGYPEIAPIEPEKPEEYKPSATLKSGTWTGKQDIVIDVQSKGGTVDVAEIYYYKNEVSLGGVKVEADIQLDEEGNGTVTLKNDKLKKATVVGAQATLVDWTKADQLEVVVLFELGEESKFKNIYLPVDYKGDTEKPEEPEKPTDPTPDKPSVNDPIVNPDTGKELSQAVVDKVVEKVENAKKGSEVVVKMQGATTVPSEVLKSVKGKDVDVVLDMGGYSWTINGKEVTADKLKDINLKVTMNSNAIPQSVVEKTADGNPVIQISLAHDGAFGFQADLKMNVGAKYKGLYAKLYYYNKEGKLEYVQSDKVEADGTVIFTFKHASDYAIILSKKDDAANTGSKTENTTPKTGDTSPLAIYVFIMLLAGGLAVFVGRRRFCK